MQCDGGGIAAKPKVQNQSHSIPCIQSGIPVALSFLHVEIDWEWRGYGCFLDICGLQVDRADGEGFVILAFYTPPSYTSATPLPARAILWIYRAIYRVEDMQTGQWSQEASVMVGA